MTRAQTELALSSAPLVIAAGCAYLGAWLGAAGCLAVFVGALGAFAWRWRT